MNEINKLLTSVLLLGAGFFAASFVGPPEVVDHLSQYLRPPLVDQEDGLRPAPPASLQPMTDGWPALPTPQPAVTSDAPRVAAQPQPSGVAPTQAMVAPASWPTGATPPATTPPAPAAPEPQADEWLTAASFDRGEPAAPAPAAPSRPLTPVRRGGDDATPAPAPTADQFAWPELRPPQRPEDADPFGPPAAAPQEVTTLRPSLEASPYGDRPRFDPGPEESAWNPLRFGDAPTPVQRQPVEATYTKHVVTDGDTLPRLAERYLGDASRAEELYELNRDRLEHPDVLPIGMVLLTPDGARGPRRLPPVEPAPFPELRPSADGAFSTVASSGGRSAYAQAEPYPHTRPLTQVGAPTDAPLTEAERLGPVDAHHASEFQWDANRW